MGDGYPFRLNTVKPRGRPDPGSRRKTFFRNAYPRLLFFCAGLQALARAHAEAVFSRQLGRSVPVFLLSSFTFRKSVDGCSVWARGAGKPRPQGAGLLAGGGDLLAAPENYVLCELCAGLGVIGILAVACSARFPSVLFRGFCPVPSPSFHGGA